MNPRTDRDGGRSGRNVEPGPLLRDPNLQTIFAVTLVAVMGVSSLTPAFPRIARVLDVSEARVGLLISVFTVPGIVLAPVLGILADRWGRKRVLVPSLLLFAGAGGACALARDFELLLGLRVLQGVGASAIGALNMTILADLYHGARRTAAMGYNSSVLGVGTAAYPAIGGALAGIAWYFPFLLPLAGLPVALLVITRLETRPPIRDVGFVDQLRRTASAANDRRVLAAFAASTVTFMIIFGPYLAFLPILLDRRFGFSSLEIGLLLTLGSLSSALASARLGRIAHRIPETRLVTLGYVAYAVLLVAIPRLEVGWTLAAPVALLGFANGLGIPSLITWLTEVVPEAERAAILAMNGSVLRLGQTLGPLLGGALLGTWGLPAVYYGAAVLAGGMAVYTARAIR